jgi:hypothetical protein
MRTRREPATRRWRKRCPCSSISSITYCTKFDFHWQVEKVELLKLQHSCCAAAAACVCKAPPASTATCSILVRCCVACLCSFSC